MIDYTEDVNRAIEFAQQVKRCQELHAVHTEAFFYYSSVGNLAGAARERDNLHTILDSQLDALHGINLITKRIKGQDT